MVSAEDEEKDIAQWITSSIRDLLVLSCAISSFASKMAKFYKTSLSTLIPNKKNRKIAPRGILLREKEEI